MHVDLHTRRKLCIAAYAEYQDADRAWEKALTEASELVPDMVGRGYWRLGNRGSQIRQLYERRDRALQKMIVARLKLGEAKKRLSRRSGSLPEVFRLRLAVRH